MNWFLNIRRIYTVNNNTLYASELTYEFEKAKINATTKEELNNIKVLFLKYTQENGHNFITRF